MLVSVRRSAFEFNLVSVAKYLDIFDRLYAIDPQNASKGIPAGRVREEVAFFDKELTTRLSNDGDVNSTKESW